MAIGPRAEAKRLQEGAKKTRARAAAARGDEKVRLNAEAEALESRAATATSEADEIDAGNAAQGQPTASSYEDGPVTRRAREPGEIIYENRPELGNRTVGADGTVVSSRIEITEPGVPDGYEAADAPDDLDEEFNAGLAALNERKAERRRAREEQQRMVSPPDLEYGDTRPELRREPAKTALTLEEFHARRMNAEMTAEDWEARGETPPPNVQRKLGMKQAEPVEVDG